MQDQVGTPISSDHEGGSGDMGASSALRASFAERLRAEGPRGALALLNDRTRFRFTGLYRLVPPELHNVSLHDRENPALNVSGAVCALSESYCSIACATEEPFTVRDASSDARLVTHPARDAVQSYAGVPIRLAGGRVLGTLCHFDGRPRMLPPGELSVMRTLAPLLAPWLRGDR